MFRKGFTLLLVCLMLMGMLPLSAFATEATEATQATQPEAPEAEAEKELIQPLPRWEAAIALYELTSHYARLRRLQHDAPYHHQEALLDSQKDSLAGYCGLFASYQLYYQGINSWMRSYHGNDHFDVYSQIERTDGGYYTKPYYLEDYTLEEALNAATKNGTFDAYNLLVCFQWTNTEAGKTYGHVVYIYGILDGIVYFTESFDTALGTKAGELIAISIPEFVKYYDGWTTYEGTILFGRPDFLDNGYFYEADMFVKAMSPTQLLSQPCPAEEGILDTVLLRSVAAGERLKVTGLYENMLGQSYYRVDEAGQTAWLPAQKAGPILFLDKAAQASALQLPQVLTEDMTFGGQVDAAGATVRLLLMDGKKLLAELPVGMKNGIYDLSRTTLPQTPELKALPEGWYTWQLVADTTSHYLRDGQVTADVRTQVLATQACSRGMPAKRELMAFIPPQLTPVKDGWYYENQTWYCYDQGQPRVGWYCSDGIDYYLKLDGSVTTGNVVIGGKERSFTPNGALRTGWQQEKGNTKYLLSNGVCAKGWLEIDGKWYYFDVLGHMRSNCWITEASQRRYLTQDGSMATGWTEVDGVRYQFDQQGLPVVQNNQNNSMPIRGSGFLPQ